MAIRQRGDAQQITFGGACPFGQLIVDDKHSKHEGEMIAGLSAWVFDDTIVFSVLVQDKLPVTYTYRGNFTVKWIAVTIDEKQQETARF